MRLTVNLDTQNLQAQEFVNSPLASLTLPRAASVPLVLSFTQGSTVVDPETTIATIGSHTAASPTVITTSEAHGFSSGDTVVIAGNVGIAKTITSSSAAAVTTITAAGHGLVSGDSVTIAGHSTASAVTSYITTSSVGAATVLTSTAHGFTTGDLVTISGHTGSTPPISGSYPVTVISANTFSVPVTVTVAGTGGTAARAATSINGTQIATVLTSSTFTIPVAVGQAGSGGTVTRATATPDINGSRVVTVISSTIFSVPVAVTTIGSGGTATRTVALNLRWTVKTAGLFDQDPPVVSLNSFIKTGSGTSTLFTGYCNYITSALNTLLGVNPPTTSDDVEQVQLMAEVSWGGASPGKVNWVTHYVRNDLYKTGEGSPSYTGSVAGKTNIPNGTSSVTIAISPVLSTAAWHFFGSPIVSNVVDGSPLGLVVVGLTARSTSAATLQISGDVDSVNYYAEWVIVPD